MRCVGVSGLSCCSVTCNIKKCVPALNLFWPGGWATTGLFYCAKAFMLNSAMARCQRQHVLKSTPVPPPLQLPWRVHDIQPLSSARCRCLLVDVLSGHAAAIKLWHVRKGANNALISLISLSNTTCKIGICISTDNPVLLEMFRPGS